jgi:hypothetical protein
MATTTTRPGDLGAYTHYRHIVVGDVAVPTDKRAGLRCSDFDSIHVQAVNVTAAPTITLYSWSDAAGSFIILEPSVTYSGAINTDFEFTFDVLGRTIWIMSSEPLDLYVSGYRQRPA